MANLLYPIMLRLEGRLCVIIGGGKVAARKVGGLLAAGAHVTVISPVVCAELDALAAAQSITIKLKPYESGDLAALRPLLVFTATNNPDVNRAAAEEARSLGILVNTTADGEQGDFHNMAAARRGAITLAVSTGGRSPTLAKALAARLAESISDDDVRTAETRNHS